MPQIRPITDLRNTNEISEICHKLDEPVFITKNGYGDLVVMSIETYERKMAVIDLYHKLEAGEKQISDGSILMEASEVFSRLRKKYDK